jgi:hypothetical protein
MDKFEQISHINKITREKHKLNEEENQKLFNKFYTQNSL